MTSSDAEKKDDVLDNLILNIKAFVLLSNNDEKLTQAVKEKLLESHDKEVGKFLSLIEPRKKQTNRGGSFLIALAELILAAFLSIAGISLMAPSLIGFQSPAQLQRYFTELTTGISTSSFSNPLLPLLDFVLSLLLLLGAFYILRRASTDLKDAGATMRQSE